jgi:hypothetical protein
VHVVDCGPYVIGFGEQEMLTFGVAFWMVTVEVPVLEVLFPSPE